MTKTGCTKGEAKKAIDRLDREIDRAFVQMKIRAIIMIVSAVGLVITVAYAVIDHVSR